MSDTIYGSNTPASSSLDNTTYCLGTDFSTDVDGTVTTMRWYVSGTAPGSWNPNVSPVKAQLWNRDTASIVASATFGSLTLGAWNTLDFSAPVDITSGVNYCISVVTDSYALTSGFFSSSVVNGHITAPTSAGKFTELGAGVGVTYSPALPSSSFNSSGYFIDVLFDASGAPSTSIFVWDGVDELPADVTVWNGSTEVPMDSFEIAP